MDKLQEIFISMIIILCLTFIVGCTSSSINKNSSNDNLDASIIPSNTPTVNPTNEPIPIKKLISEGALAMIADSWNVTGNGIPVDYSRADPLPAFMIGNISVQRAQFYTTDGTPHVANFTFTKNRMVVLSIDNIPIVNVTDIQW